MLQTWNRAVFSSCPYAKMFSPFCATASMKHLLYVCFWCDHANTFSELRGMFLSMKVLFLKIPLYFMFRAHLQTLIYPYFRSITTIVSLVLSTTVRNIFFSINWIHLFLFFRTTSTLCSSKMHLYRYFHDFLMQNKIESKKITIRRVSMYDP